MSLVTKHVFLRSKNSFSLAKDINTNSDHIQGINPETECFILELNMSPLLCVCSCVLLDINIVLYQLKSEWVKDEIESIMFALWHLNH